MFDPRYVDHIRQALEECDIDTFRKLWVHLAPELPRPKNDLWWLATLHAVRTQASSLALRHRVYSHCWLLDHGFPSGLPDHLKARAERLYPRTVRGVGVAVHTRSPLALAIHKAMSDAVEDAYAEHRTDADFIRARMLEARDKILKDG
jgi:hypothetical protein